MPTAQHWITTLELQPHPEGGWYRETYRATGQIPGDALQSIGASRSYVTSIYYLLEHGQRSALHRIKQDEMWHFHDGHPLDVEVIHPDGRHEVLRVGLSEDATPQAVVPAGCWFGARHGGDIPAGAFTLVGCTVAPGFDFDDFEMAEQDQLLAMYPEHRALIEAMT
ncbi:MAG: cupin domain-containing protein [Bradymonadia bacterium]